MLTYGAPPGAVNAPAFTWDGSLMCSVDEFEDGVAALLAEEEVEIECDGAWYSAKARRVARGVRVRYSDDSTELLPDAEWERRARGPGARQLLASSSPASSDDEGGGGGGVVPPTARWRRPLVLGCKMGQKSRMAAARLEAAGYERLYNLEGGFDAWLEEGLPFDDPEYESYAGSVPGG